VNQVYNLSNSGSSDYVGVKSSAPGLNSSYFIYKLRINDKKVLLIGKIQHSYDKKEL